MHAFRCVFAYIYVYIHAINVQNSLASQVVYCYMLKSCSSKHFIMVMKLLDLFPSS